MQTVEAKAKNQQLTIKNQKYSREGDRRSVVATPGGQQRCGNGNGNGCGCGCGGGQGNGGGPWVRQGQWHC
jgi:hypothetical protein